MMTPDQIPDHPGPQGYANDSAPVKAKRGFPWFKLIVVLIVLAVLVSALNSCRNKDRTKSGTNHTSPQSVDKPFYSRMLGTDGGRDVADYPRLVYVLGSEAVFIYRGAHYRLPDGVGPIGGDWFCSVLEGSIATITDANGVSYRVGVDRSNSPDLRRSAGNSLGSVSGGVRAFD